MNKQKQISDEEKIEIMQHFLNGGEIEYKSLEIDWHHASNPSWNWRDMQYRKRIYNYPLYFEYHDIDFQINSEQFIVEFTSLKSGVIVDKTYSNLEVGYESDDWIAHTNKNYWREVPNPFIKKIEQLEILKAEFATGDYICVWKSGDYAQITPNPIWGTDGDYILVHKRHEHILNAYLEEDKDSIGYNTINEEWISLDGDFLETYDADSDYRIKESESKVVYEVYRVNKKTGESEILTKLLSDNMLKILKDENRCQYTYHKTGRQFEIKSGDK